MHLQCSLELNKNLELPGVFSLTVSIVQMLVKEVQLLLNQRQED